MNRFTTTGIAIALAMVMASDPAAAKKRGGGGGGFIPIPGFGGSESIELVHDLDDVSLLEYKDGTYINLGYLHSGADSRWVGHIGSSSTFLDLDEEKMRLLIQMGGLSDFPPVPEKEFPYKGLMVIGGLALVFNSRKIMRKVRGDTASTMRRSVERQDVSSVNWEKMDAHIAEAAAESAPAPRPRRQRAPANGSFGKRGT